MVDKDVTGILDKKEQPNFGTEGFCTTQSTSARPPYKPGEKKQPVDELDSDGSSEAFSATEQVKE